VQSSSASEVGLAERFLALPIDERERRFAKLTDAEADVLAFDWEFWARPNQLIPPGAWIVWLLIAGRGFGKTRVGAETVRVWSRERNYVNLIGPTAQDARDVMVDGESGILAICPNGERPVYEPSKARLTWPNGARSLIFSADEPERLRGKQHGGLWTDEICAWRYQEAWDQAMFGLRLGKTPQVVVTTTPKPSKLIRELRLKSTTVVTRGTSYENKANLAPSVFSDILVKYEGTRLGRQEINAEILEDNPGALWKLSQIEAARVDAAPALQRIVVGVDPSVTSTETSDECGIVAVGIDERYPPHLYVLDDRSGIMSPHEWAVAAVTGYHDLKADRIIGETNNGGDMIGSTIYNVDPNVAFTKVTATRGKAVRAEPIAALYEQGRVHHVGAFPLLESQMCQWDPTSTERSPDRMDALVWAATELTAQGDGDAFANYIRQQKASASAAKEKAPCLKSASRHDSPPWHSEG